jgi:hypothetical protein
MSDNIPQVGSRLPQLWYFVCSIGFWVLVSILLNASDIYAQTDSASRMVAQVTETEALRLERERLRLARDQFAHDTQIANARLRLDERKASAKEGFFTRHLATLLTGLLSLGAIVVSITQIVLAQVSKRRELELASIQKEAELEVLTANHERDWNLKAVEFVAANRDLIFGESRELRERVKRVMLATFPLSVTTALFERLEITSVTTTEKETWQAGRAVATKLLLIRTDGLYVSSPSSKKGESASVLRFYPDGTVLSASVVNAGPHNVEQIARWLTPTHNALARGHVEFSESTTPSEYTIEGTEVHFSVVLPKGEIEYRGTVHGDALNLEVYSHITKYRSRELYQFIPLQSAS